MMAILSKSLRHGRCFFQTGIRILIGAELCFVPVISHAEQALVLGVFPFLPAARIQEQFNPVAEDLARYLKLPVQLKTRDSFKHFRASTAKEEYDIVFIQPFDYVRAGAPHGYRARLRVKGELSAVFVARSDSNYQTLVDLKGKRIAMPPRDAAVSLLGQKLLYDNLFNNKTDITISYQRNHFACMKQVLIHKAESCVTAPVPRKMFERKSQQGFNTLATTEPIPASLFAFHSRISQATQDRITARMLEWNNTTPGQKILAGLQFSAIITADDKTYDAVREIWERVKNR